MLSATSGPIAPGSPRGYYTAPADAGISLAPALNHGKVSSGAPRWESPHAGRAQLAQTADSRRHPARDSKIEIYQVEYGLEQGGSGRQGVPSS